MADAMPSITINAVEEPESAANKERRAMIASGILREDGTPRYKPDVAAFHALHKRPAPASLPSSSAPDARERLRSAHETLAGAQGALDRAKSAADRGRQLADEAGVALVAIGDVEAEITRERAERVSKWASDGGEKPSLSEIPMPLAERLRQRVEIERQIEALQAGNALLERGLEGAQAALVVAARAVEAAVERVLVAEGERLADELIAVEQRVIDLRFALSGLPVTWLGTGENGAPKAVAVSAKLVAALSAPADLAAVIRPTESHRATWIAFAARLRLDSEAPLEAT